MPLIGSFEATASQDAVASSSIRGWWLGSARYATLVFLWSRIGIGVVAAVVVLIVNPSLAGNAVHAAGLHDVGRWLDVWGNWDGAWYAGVAQHGYSAAGSPAFFPLYPVLARGLGAVLGGHVVLAAVAVSWGACLGAFILFHQVATGLIGRSAANRAVLYLAVFPMTFFLQAVYAEALFLFLTLLTFYLAQRGRLVWAAVACGFAMLTRPTGVVLLLVLAYFLLKSPGRRRLVWIIAVPLAMFATFPLYLWLTGHSPTAFIAAQHQWGRALSPLGPLGGILGGLVMLVEWVVWPLLNHTNSGSFHAVIYNAVSCVFLALYLVLLHVLRRRFGTRNPYFLFSAVSLAIPLSLPISGYPLLSLPRFGLVIFPLFFALPLLLSSGSRHRTYLTVSIILLVIAVARFSLYGWVA